MIIYQDIACWKSS